MHIVRMQQEGSVEKSKLEMLNLDFEMRAIEGMCADWRPVTEHDEERRQMADQYIEMNRKLR